MSANIGQWLFFKSPATETLLVSVYVSLDTRLKVEQFTGLASFCLVGTRLLFSPGWDMLVHSSACLRRATGVLAGTSLDHARFWQGYPLFPAGLRLQAGCFWLWPVDAAVGSVP